MNISPMQSMQQKTALDLKVRPHKVIEQLPKDLLDKVVGVVFSEIEILPEDD